MTNKIKNILKEFITNVVNEEELDNYSSFNHMKPYQQRKIEFLDSIKTFSDINSDDKIRKFIDYFGYEGFNDEEDAFEDLKSKILFYQKMSDPTILYRIVGVKNKKMIKTDEVGQHYTPYKWNLDGDMLMSIGYENWDEQTKPYVIEASVPHSEIDVLQTLIQNLSFPNEHEINLKNGGNGVKIIKTYKLEGF